MDRGMVLLEKGTQHMGTGGARRQPCWTSAGWPARSGVVVRPFCSTSVGRCGTAVATSRKILSADLHLNLQRMLGLPRLYPSGVDQGSGVTSTGGVT